MQTNQLMLEDTLSLSPSASRAVRKLKSTKPPSLRLEEISKAKLGRILLSLDDQGRARADRGRDELNVALPSPPLGLGRMEFYAFPWCPHRHVPKFTLLFINIRFLC